MSSRSPQLGGAGRALEGIRVLDLSNLLAGPMATMHLADFGAEVIKVERPGAGDDMRAWGNVRNEIALYFKVLNRNKRMVTLNLSTARGQELARALAARVDVVVEAFRPGAMERWGLGYDVLAAEHPGLVMAHLSGYGRTGPLADRPGFGTIAEAFSGFAAINGFPDRPPLLPPFGLADSVTSIFAAFAIIVALRHRDRAGEGQEIDLALYEGLFTLLGPQVIDYDQLGIVQRRDGAKLPFLAPRGSFRTADGAWVALAGGTQRTFERLVRCLGAEHLLDDARFTDNRRRLEHRDALEDALAEVIARRTLEEVQQAMIEAQAPGGPVLDVEQIFEDPHYAARDNIVVVDDPELGPLRMQNVVPRLSRTPGRVAHAGAGIGADNATVYGELLGLDGAALAELEREGVL
jgi:crotonobetainyl-CoA:carnitine CoA-transferase CaiB-like acyl-CoA transferase